MSLPSDLSVNEANLIMSCLERAASDLHDKEKWQSPWPTPENYRFFTSHVIIYALAKYADKPCELISRIALAAMEVGE